MCFKKLTAVLIVFCILSGSLCYAKTIIPEMPQGNKNLYEANAGFTNANVTGSGKVAFNHLTGILKSTTKLDEGIAIVDTKITGKVSAVNPSSKADINFSELTFVTKTNITVEDIGSDGWDGMGIVLRYDNMTRKRLLLRFSKDGKLRLVGDGAGAQQYITETDAAYSTGFQLTVVQTKNTVSVYVGGNLVLDYTLDYGSRFITAPYAFGIYSIFCKMKLTDTSLYFAERVDIGSKTQVSSENYVPLKPSGNRDVYDEGYGFENANYTNDALVSYTHNGGLLASTSKKAESAGVLKTAISGQSTLLMPNTKKNVNINDLTYVIKTRMTISDIGKETWHGAGLVLRYNSDTKDMLVLRFMKDNKLLLVGEASSGRQYLETAEAKYQKEQQITVIQTKSVIRVLVNNKMKLYFVLDNNSSFQDAAYSFGLYTAFSFSRLTDTSLYFAQRVDTPIPYQSIINFPEIPKGNENLVTPSSKLSSEGVYNKEQGFLYGNNTITASKNTASDLVLLTTSLTDKKEIYDKTKNDYRKIEDLSFMLSADIEIGEFPTSSNESQGGGLVVLDNGSKQTIISLMKSGIVMLYSAFNAEEKEIYGQAYLGVVEKGSIYSFKVLTENDKVSVWAKPKSSTATSSEYKMIFNKVHVSNTGPIAGAFAQQNKIKISNIQFFATTSVDCNKIRGASKINTAYVVPDNPFDMRMIATILPIISGGIMIVGGLIALFLIIRKRKKRKGEN